MGDPIPEPSWRTNARARAKPRIPLTRDAIVEAALRVLDREGVDGLSMHRVAKELGTGAGSLYWHVRNKGELLQLLSERLLAEMELPDPDPTHWQDQLKDLGRQMRALSRRHRDGARITLGRLPSGPTLARFAEWLFELLTPVGIPDRVIAYLGDMVGLYVGAYAFEESLGVASPTGEDLPPEQIVAMFVDYLLSLLTGCPELSSPPMPNAPPIPNIAPWLSVRDAQQAVAFYAAAFGATELY